jgi:hypothetical protein
MKGRFFGVFAPRRTLLLSLKWDFGGVSTKNPRNNGIVFISLAKPVRFDSAIKQPPAVQSESVAMHRAAMFEF